MHTGGVTSFGCTSPAPMSSSWDRDHLLSWTLPFHHGEAELLATRSCHSGTLCTRKSSSKQSLRQQKTILASFLGALHYTCIFSLPQAPSDVFAASLTDTLCCESGAWEGRAGIPAISLALAHRSNLLLRHRIKPLSPTPSKTYMLRSVWYLFLIGTIQCFVPVPFQLLLYINFD